MQEYGCFAILSFEFEYCAELNDYLFDLGIVDAFSGSFAVFSNMVHYPAKPNISYVKRNSCIRVNEEGTEAAAATLVGMVDGICEPGNEFVANRPFLYVIRDDRNGVSLYGDNEQSLAKLIRRINEIPTAFFLVIIINMRLYGFYIL